MRPKLLAALVATVFWGCHAPSNDRVRPLTSAEIAGAGAVPSIAPVQFTVDGDTLYGGVVYFIGSPRGESYLLTATSGDSRIYLSGRFRLDGGLEPLSLEGESRYEASSDFDWLMENRVLLSITRDGITTSYSGRYASIRVAADGLLVGEVDAVDQSRIDVVGRVVTPGTDLVVTAQGRLTGSCVVHLSSGAEILDPTNGTNPRCGLMFAGL